MALIYCAGSQWLLRGVVGFHLINGFKICAPAGQSVSNGYTSVYSCVSVYCMRMCCCSSILCVCARASVCARIHIHKTKTRVRCQHVKVVPVFTVKSAVIILTSHGGMYVADTASYTEHPHTRLLCVTATLTLASLRVLKRMALLSALQWIHFEWHGAKRVGRLFF